MPMAANWERPEHEPLPEVVPPQPEPEEPEAESLASVVDIARYRCVGPGETQEHVYIPEPDLSAHPDEVAAWRSQRRAAIQDDDVDEFTLQREAKIRVKGGGSGAKFKPTIKPLTSQERMDKFTAASRMIEGGAYLPELDEQRARRLMDENAKKVLASEKRKQGRPLKNAEPLQMVGVRVTPATKAFLRGIDLGTLLDRMVENMVADNEARAVLTEPNAPDTLAA